MLWQGRYMCPEWHRQCRSPSAGDCVLAGDSSASLPSITAWLVTLDITRLGTDKETGSEAAEPIPAAMHGAVSFLRRIVCGSGEHTHHASEQRKRRVLGTLAGWGPTAWLRLVQQVQHKASARSFMPGIQKAT